MRLAPATPITVRDRDGRPLHARVLWQHYDRIYYETSERCVLERDKGTTWVLNWDTEEAKAFAAQLLLQAS